jgi:hypothetical protein
LKNIIEFYKNRLGIDLDNLNHPISLMIDLALKTSDFEQKVLLQKLRILGLALMDIKEFNQKIYDFYLKRIVKNADISVHGFIFETIQCANLIGTAVEQNMKFEFGDHNKKEPDILLDDCGFEMTMIRFSAESNKLKADQKLLQVFRDKNKKKYANANTALLIELTQVVYYANQSIYNPTLSFNDIQKIFREESNFGVVLGYVEYVVPSNENILFKGTVYQAFSENCSNKLKEIILKITKGEFNRFDEPPLISPY